MQAVEAVKPIVVATLRPPAARTSTRRCPGAQRPCGRPPPRRSTLRQHARDVLVRQAVEAVAAHAALGDRAAAARRPARPPASCGGTRCRSTPPAAAPASARAARGSAPGCAADAAAPAAPAPRAPRATGASTRTGCRSRCRRGPPMTDGARACRVERSRSAAEQERQRSSWPERDASDDRSASDRAVGDLGARTRARCRRPSSCPRCTSAGPAAPSANSENLRLDEPALRTRMASVGIDFVMSQSRAMSFARRSCATSFITASTRGALARCPRASVHDGHRALTTIPHFLASSA